MYVLQGIQLHDNPSANNPDQEEDEVVISENPPDKNNEAAAKPSKYKEVPCTDIVKLNE
jgi:hypothetical protein